MNLLWEIMIAEMRAERAELDHRRHFTEEKRPIELIRGQIAEWTAIPEKQDLEVITSKTAGGLRMAAKDDLFEVG